MDDENLSSKDYAQIRELVASSNQRSLQSLLGFSKKSRKRVWDGASKLLPSTPKASALLNFLSKTCGEKLAGEKCNLDVEDILLALLMIDPSYITPWKALVEFASALSNDTVSVFSILQCASSIEEFVKANFSFSKRSNSDETAVVPRCIRDSMVQFVKKLTDYLLLLNDNSKHPDDKARAPVVIQLAMQLLHTLLAVCKGTDAFDEIVSVAYLQVQFPPNDIRMWLQLAQQSILLLTCAQVESMGRILLEVFGEDARNDSPSRDVPFIIASIVEIAGTLESTLDKESVKPVQKLWRRIAFVGWYQTFRYDDQCYLLSEDSLKGGIQKWNFASLKLWVSEIIGAQLAADDWGVPSGFALYFVSLYIEVLREKEISTNQGLVNEKIHLGTLVDEKEHDCCLSGLDYQSILDFVLGNKRNSILDEDVDRISLHNNGLFYLETDGTEKEQECLSRVSKLINDSLLILRHPSSALPTAIRVTNMADHMLRNCPDDYSRQVSNFAIIVKTVSYFKVPEYRTILEGKIEQDVSKESRLQNVYFSTLRLITYSALKMNSDKEIKSRLFGIIERIVSSSNIDYLDRILTILPYGRSGILNISKKLLAPIYSSWGAHEYESRTSETPLEPEILYRIIGGVRGLLELIRSFEWGETENLAWGILSDLIVTDLPPLPSQCRRWMVQTLTSYVTDGIFDTDTVERLLRATATRTSTFFGDYEIESKILASTKQMEEIRSLHRLMTILLQYLATMDGYSESRHILLAQGRESFLRAILLYKKGQLVGNQFHHGISKQYQSTREREPDSFILSWLIFLKINLYLLDNTMSKGSKIKTFGHLENSSMNQETSLLNLVSKIKEIECNDLQVESGVDQLGADCFPSWPYSQTMSNADSLNLVNVEEIEDFPCSDLLLEFLFLVPLPARESLDLDDPLSWKVVTASGFLISRPNTSSKATESVLSIETVEKTADPFLSTSSFLFRGAIDVDCGLSALDDLLTPIVSYCQALHLTLETNEARDCERIIGSLWNLYQAMASERACVKIIEYLESHLSENRTAPTRRDRQSLSLRSIYTESEIDKTVQQLRLSCLRPFFDCMSILSNTEEVVGTNLTRSLVGGILGALVLDLRAGLDGKSGGVPRELYILYCMTIEECGSLLFHQRQASFDDSVFLLFRDVTSALSNILVTVPLRDASLFRTTFILAVAVFPSMCRDLVRSSLYGSDNSKTQTVGKMLRADSALFDEVLDNCIDILIRWAALREPTLVPWLDIAGPNHARDTMDATEYRGVINHFDEEKEGRDRIPRFVHVPSPPRNRRKSQTKIPRKIRLYTKELWSWSLSCSLLGLEQKWLESERTIQVSDSMGNNFENGSSIEWNEFFGLRTMELQASLVRIHRFFSTSQGLQQQRDPRGNPIVLDMMAMNLPSAPRLRFCCLIECASRVLMHSIRRLCLVLKDGSSNNRDLSVLESVSCLTAWLSLEKEPETDFSVGVFKWLAIASRKGPPGESASSKKGDKAELFARVSTVSEQVHGMYLELKELQKLLRKQPSGSIGKNFKASEMLRYSGLKLHALEQVIPSEFRSRSFPDFPSSSMPERKRQRTTRRPARRKQIKKSHQNRNKVVDMFMNLDQGTDSPKRNTRDAYADLEDFLVEG